MADRNASKSVMGNLPSTRPARRSRRRQTADAPAPEPKAAPPKAQARPKAPARPKAAPKPRAVRSGSPALKAAKEKSAPRKPEPASPPKGTELVTTAVQAAGELAQIGLTLGGQAVKRAVKKLPKP